MSSVPKIPSSRAGLPVADAAQPRRLRALWIAWNVHRRTSGLCAAWDVPLRVIRPDRAGLRRWIEQAVESLRLLRRERPELLFIQNPSLALTVLALLVRRLFAFHLVIDAHNEGVRPFDRPGALVGWLTRRALKGADTTIVTNDALAGDVRAAGGRPVILPDSLPVPPELPPMVGTADAAPHVAVIATFRPDEPIAAIVAAAAALPAVRFTFSGNSARFAGTGAPLPANVALAGFLADAAYWELLAQADVICDLTLKTDCLVCGAYEALALGKPMVLSDNPATREIFGSAAVLTGSEPAEIAEALQSALERRVKLAANARDLRERYRQRWQAQAIAAWDAVLAAAGASSRGSA